MRSAVKRLLVTGYFSGREIVSAIRGVYRPPVMKLVDADYDEYWRQRELSGLQPRFEIIASGLVSGSSVLDVGCGDGAMLAYLRDRGLAAGTGIDISEIAVQKARARGVDARVQTLSDLHAQQPELRFDHVVISEVLEHVPDPERFVRLGLALARQTLWLTYPNIGYFPHRLRLLTGKFPVQWVVFPGEHLRFWTVPDFRDWLAALGLHATSVAPSNGLQLAGLHRWWPNLFGNQIVVRLDKSSVSLV